MQVVYNINVIGRRYVESTHHMTYPVQYEKRRRDFRSYTFCLCKTNLKLITKFLEWQPVQQTRLGIKSKR